LAGTRVDVVPRSVFDQQGTPDERRVIETISCDLPPDATSAVISGLAEKTEYIVTVRAVTAVYFDMLPEANAMKQTRQLPPGRLPTDDTWLPAVTTVVTTSGTDRPRDFHVVKTSPDSISLAWTLPRTYGSDQLQGTVIRWVSGLVVLWLRRRTHDGEVASFTLPRLCNNSEQVVHTYLSIV